MSDDTERQRVRRAIADLQHDFGAQSPTNTTHTAGHGVAGDPRTGSVLAHETPGRVGAKCHYCAGPERGPHERHCVLAGAPVSPEFIWREFWWPTMKAAILERDGVEVGGHTEDGCWVVSLRVLEQIKRELFDFHSVIQTVPAVYDHATGGAMSQATYNDVSQITGCIDENYAEIERDHVIDAIKGAREEVQAVTGSTADVLLDEFTESLRAYFNIDPKDLA